MSRIAFVVLHYETVNDTQECIESLLKYISGDTVQIVVVDNGSKTGKLDDITRKYAEYSTIHFIYSKENLGFARGNNLGFKYAKDTLKSDIIVLANNDLVFKQDDFVKKLLAHYETDRFDVAGPRIISLVDGMNQNPVHIIYHNVGEVKSRILKFRILYALSLLNLDTKFRKAYGAKLEEALIAPGEDFQLHGACMIFAGRYLDQYDGLYDRTFMYGEESILKYIVKRDAMKMHYFDDIEVYHKEGSSTQKIWGKGKKSRQFFYKWNIRSCLELLHLMQRSD